MDRIQLLDRALAQDIKRTDRSDVIAPEFDTAGILLREVEDIENIAAHRELAGTVDLEIPLIAHSRELRLDGLLRDRLIFGKMENILLQNGQRNLRRHKGRIRRDNRGSPPFQQLPQALDALCLDFAAPQVRLIEDEILCRKLHRVPVIKPAVLRDFPCPKLTVGENKPHACMRLYFLRIRKREAEVHLL